MKFFPSRTTFIQIGSISIQWYAVLILGGAFLAYYFAKKNLKEYKNIDVNDFFDSIFIYMLWGGVIGSRLWYCLFDANFNYFEHPEQIIRIWDGGVAIHGALLGGSLVAIWYCKRKNVSIIKFFDAVLPTVLLAQSIGRWGNFVNQECYGGIVDEAYYDGIFSFLKTGMYIGGEYREPMFFYESMLCLLGFIIINFVLRKHQNKRGDLAYAYMMWYGVVRFFIEMRRTDSLLIGSIKTAQVTSIVLVVVGTLGYLGLFTKLLKKKKPTMLFDLDGTLQDSTPAILAAFEELFKRYSDPSIFTKEVRAEVLGPSLKEMFSKYFPDQDFDKLYKEYKEVNNKVLNETLKPIPHAIEVLKTLKEEGYNIGVVTTRAKDSSYECFEKIGIKEYVDDVVGWQEVKNVKPDPEGYFILLNKNKWNKDDLIVIGDSVADVEGGKNVGAYTIAYLSNEDKKDQLLNSKANKNITDLIEILDIVKENHYFTYNLK